MDLTNTYGPFYGGMLGKQLLNQQSAMAENSALQGSLGILSEMESRRARAQEIQAKIDSAKADAARQAEFMQGLQNAPDEQFQSTFGMPRQQVLGILNTGGMGALSKVLQKNAEMPTDLRMVKALPPEAQGAALLQKAGVAPSFHTMDTGGSQTGYERDPITGQVRQVFNAPKTASPGSIPFAQSDMTPEQAREFEIARARAGASAAPQLNINSPLMPGKEGGNKVDASMLDTGAQMSAMSAIEQAFKPEFQTIGTKWGALKSSWRDKLGVGIDPNEKQQLAEFTAYRGRAASSLNSYIKAITGAALSEMEAERIMKAVPVAGQGIFDGDSPTEFKSKMDSVMKELRMASARYTFIKRRGFAIGDVPLEQMPRVINERGAEIKAELKRQNTSVSDADVGRMVRRRLAEEFGLVYEQ